jgi:DNA-directed RNA polymerase subunit RPC12/RpoP
MKMLALKCPDCGASVEIENGIDTFFCTYCGCKIMLDGQSAASVKAKVSLKRMEHEKELVGKKLAHKEALVGGKLAHERYKIEQETKKSKGVLALRLVIVIIAIALIVAFFGYQYYGNMRQEARLQAVLDEIEVDIANADYETALAKINSLHYDSGWEIYSDTEGKWDDIRSTLLETIENKTKAPIPKPSKEYKGDNYQEVMTELRAAGFSNIKTSKLGDLIKGWLTKDGDVEKVSVNGKTDFEADTKFPKDAEIVITYHTFPEKESKEGKKGK